ncbi:MAG: ATP-dependent helicase [Candidatus Gastranaerophilales bacterium]|nr:ATP-dependent helicase [Candidatus Gastranaerophilales bacterium]
MLIFSNEPQQQIDYIAKNVIELLNNGVQSSKILVLAQNSFIKEKILTQINEEIFSKECGISTLKVYSFSGIVYNSIAKNWITLEKILSKDNFYPMPLLCGLDSAQYFLKNIIKEEDFNDYFSKNNLMHQLLRRYKLIIENRLSPKEVDEKSIILNESFAKSAKSTLNTYKNISSKARIFDNLKQMSAFAYLIENNLINDFDGIEYFFVQGADEYNYAAYKFCEYMLSKPVKYCILADPKGCSRMGYLCGYENFTDDIMKSFNPEIIEFKNKSKTRDDAQKLFENIINTEHNILENFETASARLKLEMLDEASVKITKLITKTKAAPCEIIVVIPDFDEVSIYSLQTALHKHHINTQVFAGNEKITDDILVSATLSVLSLINPEQGIDPGIFEIRRLLNGLLNIPIFKCGEIVKYFAKHHKLPAMEGDIYNSYNTLLNLITDDEVKTQKLSEQFIKIFETLLAPNAPIPHDFECINLLLKSIEEYEKIKESLNLTDLDWLNHIKSSIVSETPSKPAQIQPDSVIIATPQKIIDYNLTSDYQIWLDASSRNWVKEDTGTIYNAWVFQKNSDIKNYTSELNAELTIKKTAHTMRKLTLCAKEKIFVYTSDFDSQGRENNSGIIEYILPEDINRYEFNFVPRDDQKEIFNYKEGSLAVPAVPGAGKTTVMLALTIKLMQEGINAKNLLILTYMESAARNFLAKIKKITNNAANLPNISTIHALAYKILLENDHFTLVNLSSNFSICDDSLRSSIIRDICVRCFPIGEPDFEDWMNLQSTGISKAKTRQISLDNSDLTVKEFKIIYDEYQKMLRELELVDYDDLLILAIKLLRDFKDVREFYQEKFMYVIEDEAQDSSAIQQEFITLLSGKYKNLIRCGDINQAITGTFSEADITGFKDFISKSKKVEMHRSQRCTKQIYELANNFINYSKTIPVYQDAFYNIKMAPVKGKNPKVQNPISIKKFEENFMEKEFVLNDIKRKLEENKSHTFGILLRRNKQVLEWAQYLEKNNLKVIFRGDNIKQKKSFLFILGCFEVYLNPYDNKAIAKLYKLFCEIEKFRFNEEIFNLIEKERQQSFINPEYIKNFPIKTPDLEEFWWAVFEIAENPCNSIQELIIRVANSHFEDVTDKSNAHLFSILIKRYINSLDVDEKFSLNKLPQVIKYFKNLLTKGSIRNLNLFSKEDESSDLSGYVQIMTIHKAKGDEFSSVYIPEFSDFNYQTDFVKLVKKIKNRKKPLLNKLDALSGKKNILPSSIAKEEIEETLRLIYVAITRAKAYLTFSCFTKKNTPSALLEFFRQED